MEIEDLGLALLALAPELAAPLASEIGEMKVRTFGVIFPSLVPKPELEDILGERMCSFTPQTCFMTQILGLKRQC